MLVMGSGDEYNSISDDFASGKFLLCVVHSGLVDVNLSLPSPQSWASCPRCRARQWGFS